MLILSFIKRYWYLKRLDKLVFPEEPIPIKIICKGRKPAGYWNTQKGKLAKEWYEVAIVTTTGNEFEIAVHEVRHRVQCHYPEMTLFTKNKLIEIQRKNPQEAIQQIIAHLEAMERKDQKPLSEIEQDAIIIEKIMAQKCRGVGNPVKIASQWIKKTP
jgi:hypothetical protein